VIKLVAFDGPQPDLNVEFIAVRRAPGAGLKRRLSFTNSHRETIPAFVYCQRRDTVECVRSSRHVAAAAAVLLVLYCDQTIIPLFSYHVVPVELIYQPLCVHQNF
jgi:hypothetical protein